MITMISNLSFITKSSLALSEWIRFTVCLVFRCNPAINLTQYFIASLQCYSILGSVYRWGVVAVVRKYNFPPYIWTEIGPQMSTWTMMSCELLTECPLDRPLHCFVKTQVLQLCVLSLSLIYIPYYLLLIMCWTTLLFAWHMRLCHNFDAVLVPLSFPLRIHLYKFIGMIRLGISVHGINIRSAYSLSLTWKYTAPIIRFFCFQ